MNWRVCGGRSPRADGRILDIVVPTAELGCDGEDDEDTHSDEACQGVAHHPSDPPRATLDEPSQETTHRRLVAQQQAGVSVYDEIGGSSSVSLVVLWTVMTSALSTEAPRFPTAAVKSWAWFEGVHLGSRMVDHRDGDSPGSRLSDRERR